MPALRVLIIGGTGTISSACVSELNRRGRQVTVMNRGKTSLRPLHPDVEVLVGDIRDLVATRDLLATREFDAVVDFVAFTRQDVELDIELFGDRCGQFVFISSASAYQKPPGTLPIRESTPLCNPFWQYSRDKIAAEEALIAAYRERGFPVTIVRPSHTYDRTSIPVLGGWTVVERMRRGLPVVVHGDGTSLWVLTHQRDFARAFACLLGDARTIGDSYHITSDEALTWNQIYGALGAAAGATPELLHVASESIAAVVPEWRPNLLGDFAHSVVFDNAKVKALAAGWAAEVPFAEGAREIVDWYDDDPTRRQFDARVSASIDALVAHARSSGAS